MLILGLDTSTSALTVALGDGDRVLARAARVDARGHSEHLAPLIADLLSGARVAPGDLTAIAVGNGPGPFTGLRVGLVTALTMSHALGVPAHGVCSLDALAWAAPVPEGGSLLVATDARRREVYWATYAVRDGSVERLRGPAVDRPADLPESVRALPVVGRGPSVHPGMFAHDAPEGHLDVDAGALVELVAARLGAGQALPVEPLYLRRPDALTTAERERA